MFDKNENDAFDPNNEKQNDITTEYTQPVDDIIDPVNSSLYENSESFQCPFDDMYRIDDNEVPMPYAYPHQPIQSDPYSPQVTNRPYSQPMPYPPHMPIRPHPQPMPYPPHTPIRPHPQPLPYPPRPIHPMPYPHNVHLVIHHHHHFYHNRPHDGK